MMDPFRVLCRIAATCAVAAVVVGSSASAQKAPLPAQGARASSPAADTGLTMGSFVSTRMDGKKLPVRDLASDDAGTQYLIEFDELVMSLKSGGEFRASLKYRQTLAAKGMPTTQEPLQRMTVYGTWIREGSAIRFVPDPKRGGEGLRILAGTYTSKSVTVPFDYRNGRVSRRSTVVLVYDPTIF
ncbi:MAG: hypothetical protein O2973_04740 [Gemmatimonadetes bacterium]|nr:hypothetical protein [Gemmatimonadota bacterium]